MSFSHKFCSYFIDCCFAYRAKSWIQLRTNTYITIFVFLSPGSCFESATCIQNSFESASIALISSRLREGKIIHKKSLRAPFYTLIFHSEATWTSINVFPFLFKCQRSNLSILGMKTRPWKFVDSRNTPWLPALFERVIWRQKTIFNSTGWPRF